MPAVQVPRQNVLHRSVAAIVFDLGFDSSDLAGSPAIPAVQNHPLINNDRFAQAILLNVVSESSQLRSIKQRKML
jgi:hypothetical protein